MFHVGQKVVCVDAKALSGYVCRDMDGLKKGGIYTVRETGIAWLGCSCIRLAEIIRPQRHGDDEEAPFRASRFRPVTERKTYISVFTAMLTGAPNDVERVE